MSAETVSSQLRRRRAASYRCQSLTDGRRDPVGLLKPQATIRVRPIGANTVEFTGCDRAVLDAISTMCARYQRAPRGGAWLVQQDFADDVMALLESRSYRVEVTL